MKYINFLFNFFLIILTLLVVNHFIKVVSLPQWLVIAVLAVSAILFLARSWFRFKGRR